MGAGEECEECEECSGAVKTVYDELFTTLTLHSPEPLALIKLERSER